MVGRLGAACVCTLVILLSACMQKSVKAGLPDPPREPDPFISTIESMKHSVAPVVCMGGDGPQANIQELEGSAFFLSRTGEFLTAAHVLDEMKTHAHSCLITAIYLPSGGWRADTPEETVHWFPFRASDCFIERGLDVAKCSPLDDLSVPRQGFSFEIRPVKMEFSDQADGTQVAFTGFPLGTRDPFTSRGGIAAYRTSKDSVQLVLDQTTWGGASGSPVYLSDGRVIGIMLARGVTEGSGLTIVRPARLIRPVVETEISLHSLRWEQHSRKPTQTSGE